MFVAAYEFEMDNTLPPLDREEQKKWKPKHRARVRLCLWLGSRFKFKTLMAARDSESSRSPRSQ
jgi:hypothetical protein